MKIVWVTRSFLDYRIPVFQALDKLIGGQLVLLFSGDYVPAGVQAKARAVLGDRAIALSGEWRLGAEDREFMANRNISLRYQPGLGKKIREFQPDVMVADGFFKWTFPCLLERRRRGTPLAVCYERTANTERGIQWYRKIYRRWALGAIDAMCCNGRLSAEYVQSMGFPADRITRGHMAADTDGMASACAAVPPSEISALRRELNLTGSVFLYVGRLIPRKGLEQLLVAWAGMSQKTRGQAVLLLAGDGPERPKLEAFCREHGLDNVRFAGAVAYDRIAVFYALADFFVIPTLEDNWSLVVPEAMACGLPILCSTYNGCWPELVKEGQNGWVFDPLNAENTQRVLETALAAAKRLPSLSEASRRIIAEHSPARAAREILHACRLAARQSPPKDITL